MTQADQILRHLKSGQSITPMEALNRFGCFRLAARVNDLRNAGYVIEGKKVGKGRKKWAEYRLSS